MSTLDRYLLCILFYKFNCSCGSNESKDLNSKLIEKNITAVSIFFQKSDSIFSTFFFLRKIKSDFWREWSSLI